MPRTPTAPQTLTLAAILVMTATAMTACDPQHPTDPTPQELHALFVSGHLGSYRDCPELAHEAAAPQDPAQQPDAARDADCDSDQDTCAPLNCEPARITLTLRNESDLDAEAIHTIGLFLLDPQGRSITQLRVEAITTQDNTPFDATLPAGQEQQIHITFAGPLDLPALIAPPADARQAWQTGARLRLFLATDTHGDLTLDTVELFSLPEVDT